MYTQPPRQRSNTNLLLGFILAVVFVIGAIQVIEFAEFVRIVNEFQQFATNLRGLLGTGN